MSIITPAFEQKYGIVLVILLGACWTFALLQLGVHALRRKLGWYERRPLKVNRAKTRLRIFDISLFLFFCGLGILIWWLYFYAAGTVIFKTGILSLALALLTILVVFREGLTQRIKAGKKPSSQTSSHTSENTES